MRPRGAVSHVDLGGQKNLQNAEFADSFGLASILVAEGSVLDPYKEIRK
jgi:hypothetical protein